MTSDGSHSAGRKHICESPATEPAAGREPVEIKLSISRLKTYQEKKPCLETLTKARRHLSRSVPSAIQWRTVENIRLGPTFGVCLDARQARQKATPTLRPTKARASSGMRTP